MDMHGKANQNETYPEHGKHERTCKNSPFCLCLAVSRLSFLQGLPPAPATGLAPGCSWEHREQGWRGQLQPWAPGTKLPQLPKLQQFQAGWLP